MRNRRTKGELVKIANTIFELLKKGYDPHAICEKTGERRDLVSGIISKILEDHPDMAIQIRIVHVSKTIEQLLGDSSVEFVKFEKDSTGAIVIIPELL